MGNSIPPQIIRQIKDMTSLRDVVSSYVVLDRHGKGRCPFHGDAQASFSINKTDRYWKCFGCGLGGDVIKYIELIERVNFLEAVRKLAVRLNITLPDRPQAIQDQTVWKEKKKSVARINCALEWLRLAEIEKVQEIRKQRHKLPKSKKDWDSNDYLKEQYIDYRLEELDIKMRKLEKELLNKKQAIGNQ